MNDGKTAVFFKCFLLRKTPFMTHFSDFDLPTALHKNLQALNLITPTPIQQEVIPLALGGRDILGTAQTGTGKTLAFALPMVTYLMHNPAAHALVLAPTRELAAQVLASIKPLLKEINGLRSALLIAVNPWASKWPSCGPVPV